MAPLHDLFECAVPAQLAGFIQEVYQKTGHIPNSVYRGPGSQKTLNKYGKQDQQQLYDGWVEHKPGYNPADRPGTSTHECRSDGVAYPGPVGRKLAGWQCGMDYDDDDVMQVMAAFRQIGLVPIHPYPSGSEYHHINIAKAPKVAYPFLPLKLGSRSYWVLVLRRRLNSLDGGPTVQTSGFLLGKDLDHAVRAFQETHGLVADGVVGIHTWVNLKAAVRAVKRRAKSANSRAAAF